MLLRCCKYSHYAYSPQMISPKHVTTHIKCPKNSNTRGMVLKDQKRVFVSFKGSNSISDLIEAANIMPVETKYGLVHQGFWKQYQSIKNQLSDELAKVDAAHHIYFTGHSMGGCIAMLCALDAMEWLSASTIRHCYMFGSPAFCNATMLENASTSLHDWFCVDLTRDLISQVPLNPLFVKPKPPYFIKLEGQGQSLIESHSCSTYYNEIKKRCYGTKIPEFL